MSKTEAKSEFKSNKDTYINVELGAFKYRIYQQNFKFDKNGNFVPRADNLIRLEIEGPAGNIGFDNGDPLDLSSTKLNEKRVFNGKCLLILQSKKVAGMVNVKAMSEGIETAEIALETL